MIKKHLLANNNIDQSKIAGSLKLKNVQLVDRPFGISSNSLKAYIDLCRSMMIQGHLTFDPIQAAVPDAALITALGATDVTVNDLVAPMRIRVTPNQALNYQLPILGYLVSQKFTQNTVAPSFALNIRNYAAEGTLIPLANPSIFVDLNRQIQVTATGGGNSTSEYLVLNMLPPYTTTYDTVSRSFAAVQSQKLSLLSPFNFSIDDGAVGGEQGLIVTTGLIFKNQASVNQVTNVTPILNTSQGLGVIVDALNNILLGAGK